MAVGIAIRPRQTELQPGRGRRRRRRFRHRSTLADLAPLVPGGYCSLIQIRCNGNATVAYAQLMIADNRTQELPIAEVRVRHPQGVCVVPRLASCSHNERSALCLSSYVTSWEGCHCMLILYCTVTEGQNVHLLMHECPFMQRSFRSRSASFSHHIGKASIQSRGG